MFGFVKRPVFTEKTTRLLEKYNQYVFDVDPRIKKSQVRVVVEKIFGVPVRSVNTYRIPRRSRNFKSSIGFLPNRKRAIVSLRSIEKILLFP